MLQEGLKNVVATKTAISFINGKEGKLIYRGYSVNDLVMRFSFEEIVYLLWYGQIPNKIELNSFVHTLKIHRNLPSYVYGIIEKLPKEIDMMSKIRTVISSIGTRDFKWKPTIGEAVQLTAVIPTIIANLYRKEKNLKCVAPRQELNHIENYLYMITGKLPSSIQVKILETYMILTMEHGLNASTFAARVITSTESDIVSAAVGAMGAMKGTLHGGALLDVFNMLHEIEDKKNAESWLRRKLENKERIMGFGHRIYKTNDPRAAILRKTISQFREKDTWLELAIYIEELALQLLKEYKPTQHLYTNVDFYAAVIMKALNIDPVLFTPTFSVSRIAGWSAHILEQSENNTIFRPESLYIGEVCEINLK